MLKLQQKVNLIHLLHDGDRGRCEDLIIPPRKVVFDIGKQDFGENHESTVYMYGKIFVPLFVNIY